MNLTRNGQNSNNLYRVCCAQIRSIWEDPQATLAKAELFVRHAAESGAHIICFPEQFATGWDPASSLTIQDTEGGIVSTLRRFAHEYQIGILGSFRERFSPAPRNTAVAIGNNGTILSAYSKIHLFSPAWEDRSFSPGSELGIFSLGTLSCGITICYDLRFPDLFRIYAQKGVQAVFVQAAWPASRVRHWELFISARAAENQMYIIGINTTGTTPVDTYSGASMVADPNGNIIARANETEQLLFVDLEPGIVERIRLSFPVGNDRKNALYRKLSQ